MDDQVEKYKDQLKGLVSVIQIKNKCIQLEFDEEKIAVWAQQLITTDKGFEWNTTVTPE
jgi:hypothetical protein